MTPFKIPPFQIDPGTLPPPILTSEAGSFAHDTVAVRLPRIVLETIELNAFPPDIVDSLHGLRSELTDGVVRGLEEDTPDHDFWNDVSREYIGRSWLDVPWYWAETFFYRRILEATRYFQPGPMHESDPFRPTKLTELAPGAAPRTVAIRLRALPDDPGRRFESLLYSSLWGNRTDLSYKVAMEAARAVRFEDEHENLLADDSSRLWEWLHAKRRSRLALVADNTGTEVTMDLALADFLLAQDLAETVTFHLKPHPFFVSDATLQDVEAGLESLARGEREAQSLAERLRAYREQGRLNLYSHWFYTTPFFYFQLPGDLRVEFSRMDFVILKGDVNYRRLLGDAHWDPTTPFGRATAYFPAPLVALRTMKAQLIVGLSPGESERLDGVDPNWMVNGRRGLVQARL